MYFNDQTLGGLDGSRVVVLRGTTTVSQLFSPNFFDISGWLKTALENAGFSVNAVRTSAAEWIGYSNNLEIEINVFNSYTSEQARANAIRAIEAYTANFGFNKVFFNTTLSVASDAYAAPGTPRIPPRTGDPPSNYDRSDQTPAAPFLDNLGLGLGISTPIIIGAAVLVAVLMLKK